MSNGPQVWTDAGCAFLEALIAESVEKGFVPEAMPTYAVGERWRATLRLRGPLGTYTLVLSTSWAHIHDAGESVNIEVLLGNDALLPILTQRGLQGFREMHEYLLLIVQYTSRLTGLMHALKCAADRTWWSQQRAGFVALLQSREMPISTGPKASA